MNSSLPPSTSASPPARRWSLLLRVASSVLILALLIWLARGSNILSRLESMQPFYLAAAIGALACVVVCNSLRWQVLLAGYQIKCGFWEAMSLYYVSLFFTLFLPGSVGGDVVRSYYIARQHGRLAAVLLATIQERLAGLGSLLVLGCIAVFLLRNELGAGLSSTLGLVQIGTLGAVAVALYPAPLFALGQRLWQRVAQWQRVRSLVQRFGSERLQRFLAPATEPLRLQPTQFGLLALALCGSAIFGVCTYWLLALALSIKVSWMALCIAASVVTLARTLPISINGIGVGEGAFVVMLHPFGVANADALALSLSGLAVQSLVGLVGGVVYAVLLSRGVRLTVPKETP